MGNYIKPIEEKGAESTREQNFLESMLELSPHTIPTSSDGKNAYNCDPCDGCGPSASFSDIALYEKLKK